MQRVRKDLRDQREKEKVIARSPVLKNRFDLISTNEEQVPDSFFVGTARQVSGKSDKLTSSEESMLAPMRREGNMRVIGGRSFKKISGLVDSGAVDNVTNKFTAPWIPIEETMASRSGLKYTVADGSTVLNKGQQKFG